MVSKFRFINSLVFLIILIIGGLKILSLQFIPSDILELEYILRLFFLVITQFIVFIILRTSWNQKIKGREYQKVILRAVLIFILIQIALYTVDFSSCLMKYIVFYSFWYSFCYSFCYSFWDENIYLFKDESQNNFNGSNNSNNDPNFNGNPEFATLFAAAAAAEEQVRQTEEIFDNSASRLQNDVRVHDETLAKGEQPSMDEVRMIVGNQIIIGAIEAELLEVSRSASVATQVRIEAKLNTSDYTHSMARANETAEENQL